MKNKTNADGSLAKDYVHASGMMVRVGKAVLGLVLFSLAKMGKLLFYQAQKTKLPSSKPTGTPQIKNGGATPDKG